MSIVTIPEQSKSAPQQTSANRQEKIRTWRLAKAAHKLKNRSSKSILTAKKHWHKNYYSQLSEKDLQALVKAGNFEADMELVRRDKLHEKRLPVR